MKRNLNKIKKAILLSILVFFCNYSSFAQSDTPCGTTPLTLGSSCVFTTLDASVNTLGTEGGTPSCGHYGTTLVLEDSWYSFVAPASGAVNLESSTVTGSTYDYADMVVYSGPCTALTEIDCFGGYGGSVMPHFELTGLTPGETYYVRLYGVWDSNGGPRTIDFCAYAAASPPPNDECIDAIPAVINPDQWCDLVTPGTITGATESPDDIFCPFGINPNDDVWFSFAATNPIYYIHLLNIIGSTNDLSYSLHSGPCGSTNLGQCQDGVGGSFNNLTIGDTYYLRVFSTGNSAETVTFDLCITLPPVMPSCATNPVAGNTVCTATPICNLDGYCGTTSGTYSPEYWPELIGPFCGTIENNSFLSVTASATSLSFYVWVNSTTNNAGIQIMIFSADNCASGPITEYTCWSPGSASSIATLISASGLTIGEEYYIMIDGNGGDIGDFTIAAFDGIATNPEISSVLGDTSICLGQSLDLYVTGTGTNYTWTPGTYLNTTTGDTVTSTPTSTGSITYSVESNNALCPTTSSDFTMTVTSSVTGTDTQVTCGSFTWIDGVNYTASNTTATFTLAGGSVAGCDSIVTLDLTISPAVTGTDTQIACGSYTWIDGINYTASNSTATFTIVGGSVAGCDSIVTLDLTISPFVTGTDTQTTCGSYIWIDGINYTASNSTATFTLAGGSVAGCDSIVTLNLTMSAAINSIESINTCENSLVTYPDGTTATITGNTSYTSNLTTATGCDSIIVTNVNVDLSLPTASNPLPINVECIGDVPASDITVIIDEADNDGIPVVTFVSDVSDGLTCPETITRTYSVTDDCGNQILVTQIITVNDITNPTASNPIPISVPGSMDVPTPDVTVVTNEADNCTIIPIVTWVSDVSDGNVCNLEVITRTYSVTDDCGNQILVTQEITILAVPAPIDAGPDLLSCENNEASLTAVNSWNVPISWDNSIVDAQLFVPNATMTYTVTADNLGCISTDQVVITIEDLPIVTFTGDILAGCAPLTTTLTNTSTTSSSLVDCVWEFSDGGSAIGCGQVTHTFISGGLYDITLTTTSENGCVNSDTYTDYISVENNPIASFTPSQSDLSVMFTEVTFNNTSTNATDYIWNFGDATPESTVENPTHVFPDLNSGAYVVQLIAYSQLGCTDTAYYTIKVTEDLIFYIPNSFTPDGDEYNEYFQPIFTAGYDPQDFHLIILNRWGEIIWESFDASIGWNGTYAGSDKLVQDGTYSWKIEFKTAKDDSRVMVVGHVNVIR